MRVQARAARQQHVAAMVVQAPSELHTRLEHGQTETLCIRLAMRQLDVVRG